MKQYYDILKSKLKENDLRLTNQRKIILESLLENRNNHLNVEELYRHINKNYPEIGIATVYRTLDMFVDLGIAHKMEFGDKGARYELRESDDSHYHHHLFCIKCGEIIEFNTDGLDELEKTIMDRHNFLIQDHSLRFYGLCEKCRKEKQEEI
jgi:Fur family ferric uptake transcriptional regulator